MSTRCLLLCLQRYLNCRGSNPQLDSLDSGVDIVDFDADVVDPAVGVLLDESGDGRLLTEGKEQLDLRVLQLHEDYGDAVFREIFRFTENETFI